MLKFSIHGELEKRILILDGGLGTMIQGYGLTEEDYRGKMFAHWPTSLKGCNDALALTAPHVLERIHEAYCLAGADIVSTDSFNANRISMADYGLEDYCYEINRAAARVARFVADRFTEENPSKPRFVAGSMGPTNRTASMSGEVNNPASREVTFDDLVAAYGEQVRGLIDGGVDLFLVETIFDTLNAKAALRAIEMGCAAAGKKLPAMISGTLTDASGRTLSGQTVEAFYTSLAFAKPLSIGLNCAFGARQLRGYLARLAAVAGCRVSAHPNAGLPNVMGGYDETAQMMADDVEEYLKEGLINIIGGCCGTTPAHIAAIAQVARRYSPRRLPEQKHITALSGLERLEITPQSNFINIGERTNVAGSAKFARLIRENKYDEALRVARDQVDAGAQIVDVCMDDGLIDGVQAMTHFLNLAMSEPEIARVPFMIDSSRWEVLEAGLKCVQGKSIVNSISLKEGEKEFVRRARLIQSYGAAAVVMLFDQDGQADVYQRKIEVAKRAYDILKSIGFPPEDIIFDPNVLAVATGIEEHNGYGIDFIEACRWIKQNLPHAKVSGGVSNLSFSFRGNNAVREAMHSVFLYHAIAAGMDMGIVNPAMLQVYSDIPAGLLELTEDVVLNRRTDATERLAAYAENVKGESSATVQAEKKWRGEPLESRIAYAMTKGMTDYIEEDTLEAYNRLKSPLKVIDNLLMPAMENVGALFGEGKMFLPQVVKSARVMKKAVGVLTPYIEKDSGKKKAAGKVLVATVKGDVHDIGKNIVVVVTSCNGYEIDDLGVMVECERIVDRAAEIKADVIGLSGLITPSLEEMIKVVEELGRRGMTTPVIIGGATTSKMHTAVKIAPRYPGGVVIQSGDASDNVKILSKLLGPDSQEYVSKVKAEQARLREKFLKTEKDRLLRSLSEARVHRHIKNIDQIVVPDKVGRVVFKDYPISEVADYIDWNFFFPAWGLKGHYPEILKSKEKGEEAKKLLKDAKKLLKKITAQRLLTLNGVFGVFPANSEGDNIIINEGEETFTLPMLRNQEADRNENPSLADYVTEVYAGVRDYVGAFAVTAGIGLDELVKSYREAGDEYNAIMAKLLADRLTEAFAESVHTFIRQVLWNYEQPGELTTGEIIAGKYMGRRIAFGYPSAPDHSLKQEVFELLGAQEATSMTLTENHMINPGESLCGLIFADKKLEYFSVGHIDEEQFEDYLARRETGKREMRKILAQHL